MSTAVNCEKCLEPVQPEFAFCESCGWPVRPPGAPAAADAALDQPNCTCGGVAFDSDGYCETCGRKPALADGCEVQTIADLAACASHCGRHHEENQDAMGLLQLPDGSVVMVVADGVSTACRARRAAETAVQQVLKTVADGDLTEPGALLELAVKRAHTAICRLPYDIPQLAEPQATVALAMVRHDAVWYAWVGDSRVYLLHDEASRQLSIDDSWLNDRLREGVPYDVAVANGNSHCITQCLGMRDAEPQIHLASVSMPAAGWLVLCSDGLWNYFPDAGELWARVNSATSTGTVVQACAELVECANRAGGSDNITAAICRRPHAHAQN